MPLQLDLEDVAGATVAVVKDGKRLFAKGYGYADVKNKKRVVAEETLFRPGSVSNEPKAFESIGLFPAGSLTSSATQIDRVSGRALVGFCGAFVIFQLELLTQRTLDGTITCFVGVASVTEKRGYANAKEVANHYQINTLNIRI